MNETRKERTEREKIEQSLEDAAKARRRRIDDILNRCVRDGYKARSRGQMKPMNPFSADTQPHQHEAWNYGWEQRDTELKPKAEESPDGSEKENE